MRFRFTLPRYLFSFRGRLSRAEYWSCWLAGIGAWAVVIFISFMIVGFAEELFGPALDFDAEQTAEDLLAIPSTIFVLWFYLAISAKRYHDRDKPGWWALIAFIPYVGPLWTLVECGFLRGTFSENRFGPVPFDHVPTSAENGRSPTLRYLFSFEGRIDRAECWICWPMCFAVGFAPILLGAIIAAIVEGVWGVTVARDVEDAALIWSAVPGSIGLAWTGSAVAAKRWHDRDKSGWWVLIVFVPLIGLLWMVVECGFLRGTVGDNRYGPDRQAPGLETVFE